MGWQKCYNVIRVAVIWSNSLEWNSSALARFECEDQLRLVLYDIRAITRINLTRELI